MNWIKGKPTEDGYYWVKDNLHDYPIIIEVERDNYYKTGWEVDLYAWYEDEEDGYIITHHMPIEKPEGPHE